MNPNNNAGAAGNQDYLDKAFTAGANKFGGAQGKKIAGNRGMSEKIVCYIFFFFSFSTTRKRCVEFSLLIH
jgi:hypothetical protein